MSRVALRKQDAYEEKRIVDSTDWFGDFDIDVAPQKPKFRVLENPNLVNMPYHRPAQRKKSSHSAMAFLAVVLFFTLSVFQITRVAAINEKGKEIASLKSEIKALQQDTETKALRLTLQENIERVRDVATRELNMSVPTESQTIVLDTTPVEKATDDTGEEEESAQNVEALITP